MAAVVSEPEARAESGSPAPASKQAMGKSVSLVALLVAEHAF